MKTRIKTTYLLLSCILLIGCSKADIHADYTAVIPRPVEVRLIEGENKAFKLRTSTKIVYQKGNEKQKQNAKLLAQYIKQHTGLKLTITEVVSANNAIILASDYQSKNKEAYKIDVKNELLTINGASEAGTFYGVQTIRKSLPTDAKEHTVYFPSAVIEDAPQLGYRGVMLDVSRHFFDKETVFQMLDVMAYLNMNTFHMHLTDENGWRIEIKKYPKLTEIGAEGNWHDREAPRQAYTQEDIKQIVAYASERNIMVIPEIDMPGHATSASKAYPNISGGGTGRWEGFTFHPAKEETYDFLDDILTEVAELFPSPYIHIGGDEVHYGNQSWKTDPLIQQFIKDNNLKNEVELEHYFVRRMCDVVNSKGKKMIGWDEILASGVQPHKAVIIWWRHDKPEQLTTALERGFDVIVAPRLPCYFDFVQHDTQKVGRRWGGKFNTLESVYDFPNSIIELIKGHEKQIIGMQACIWTERIADVKRLNYMTYPRLAAIGEDAWTPKELKDYKDFERRLPLFYKYLDMKGINYFNLFDVESTPEPWGPDKADVIAEG